MKKYYIKKELMYGKIYYMIYIKLFYIINIFYERWNTKESSIVRLNELNKY